MTRSALILTLLLAGVVNAQSNVPARMTLTWDNNGGESNIVERAIFPLTNYATIATIAATNRWVDTNVVDGIWYNYQVRASSSGAVSAASNTYHTNAIAWSFWLVQTQATSDFKNWQTVAVSTQKVRQSAKAQFFRTKLGTP